MEDPRGCTVPRVAERQAGHDRVVAVRPLIELDDLVPVLGLVQRLIRIEPHRRLNAKSVLRLVHSMQLFVWNGPQRREHATRRVSPTTAGGLPGAREVGFAVGQSRCRRFAASAFRARRCHATRRLRVQR